MKPANPALVTLISTTTQYPIAELYTVAFNDGSFDYFTSLDIPITYGGNTFKANSLRFEGLKFKISVGLQVDEQDLKVSAFPFDVLGGAAFFASVQEGLLDGAYITRQRAFWAINTGFPIYDYLQTPVDVITLFVGRVAQITKIGRTSVEMKLKSPLSLLDIDMPRNSYQPPCNWVLYDTGCTLNRASFTTNYTVLSATNTTIDVTPGTISPIFGPDGLAQYKQGRLLFTSGVNDNLQVMMSDNSGQTFYLQYPLIDIPNVGDTFAVSLGCSKSRNTCSTKFSNLVNFRGFDRVPPEFTSL